MNHIYRVVWSASAATWVAVSEIAGSRGKGSNGLRGRNRNRQVGRLRALTLVLALSSTSTGWAQTAILAPGAGNANAYVAPNGVTVVNINKANAAGLSHNRYSQFNVDPKGLVLNNATSSAGIAHHSQLAGQVMANMNLTDSARVILNEVTSNNRSHLAGFTEVLGKNADVLLANPYGITCAGCGFINSDRVTLTTGTPLFGANGILAGLDVKSGDILVTGAGLNASAQQVLDLVTRGARIDGAINANDLSITTGTNQWDYDTRAVTSSSQQRDGAPAYAIDSSALGGMYANRIRLTATEQGVGVRMLGEAAATLDDFTLDAAGRIQIASRVSAQKDIRVASDATGSAAIALTDATLNAARNSTLRASQGALNVANSTLIAGNNLQATATAFNLNGPSRLQASNTLQAQATAGDLNLGSAAVQVGSDLSLTASQAIHTQSQSGQGIQSLQGDVQLKAGTGLFNKGNIVADVGAITVRASGTLDNSGTISANEQIHITDADGWATQSVENRGNIISDANLELHAAQVRHQGWLQSGSNLTVSADNLDTSGNIVATGGNVQLSINDRLDNTGKVQAAHDVSVAGANGQATTTLSNHGEMRAMQSLRISSQSLDNAGTLVSSDLSDLRVARLVNDGDIYTDGLLTVTADLLQNNANLLSGGTMALSAVTFNNAKDGWVQSKSGTTADISGDAENLGVWLSSQQADAEDDIKVGGQLSNSGSLQSGGDLSVDAGSVDNTGDIAAAQALSISATHQLDNRDDAVLQAGSTLALSSGTVLSNAQSAAISGAQLNLHSAQGLENDGLIQAQSGDANLYVSGVLNNRGNLLAQGRLNMSDVTGGATQAIRNDGWIQADSGSTIKAATLHNSNVWLLSTQQGSPLSTIALSGQLTNATGATLQAQTDAALRANGIQNSAQAVLRAGGSLLAETTSGSIDNAGTLQAGDTVDLSGAGALSNRAGATILADELQLAMGSIDNYNVIQGGNSANSVVSAQQSLTNRAGAVITVGTSASGGGTVSGGKVDNLGTLQSMGDLNIEVGASGLSNTGNGTENGRIVANRNVTIQARNGSTYDALIEGSLQSGNQLTIRGNSSSRFRVDGTASSNNKIDITIGTVDVGAQGTLAAGGDLNLQADTLALAKQGSGASAITGRILAAQSRTGTGNIVVNTAFTQDGLLFSGHNLSVAAPSITVGYTAAIAALNNLHVHANGGKLDLTTASPASGSGNLNNSGLLYAGNHLFAQANGTLTNGVNAGSGTSSDMQINSDGDLTLVANTLINNTLINAGKDINIIAATFRNEIAGGDTRNTLSNTPRYNESNVPINGAREINYRDDGAGQNKDKAWLYEYTYTQTQQYLTPLPSLVPQITSDGDLNIYFHEGKNLAATLYAGKQMKLQGFSADAGAGDPAARTLGIADDFGHGFKLSGGSFLNDNLALETRSHTVRYSLTTKMIALGPATYYDKELCTQSGAGKWDSVCFTDGVNDTYESTWSSPANAGLYATTLRGAGLSLTNRGAKGPMTINVGGNTVLHNDYLSGKAPVSMGSARSTNKGSAVTVIGTAGRITHTGLSDRTDIGFSSGPWVGGKSFLGDNAANGVEGTSFGGINIALPGNPNGYFVRPRDPNARYLVETNPLYLTGSAALGSHFLAELLGYNSDTIGLRLGDASYEAWLVKQQIIKQTGTAVLTSYANAESQMKGMMEQAADQSASLNLEYGKALTPEQQAALGQDIVWMVQTEIDGQTVLAPVVYLAQSTRDQITTGAVITAQDVQLDVASLTNTGGALISNQNLIVESTGDISNLSGLISGGDVTLTSTEGSIVNQTLGQGSGGKQFYTTQVGKTAEIRSTGILTLDAKEDITNLGATMHAGTDASLTAGNNLVFDTIETKQTDTSYGKINQGFSTTTVSTAEQIQSGLTVGGDLTASAGNDLTLAGTQTTVGGDATLHGTNVNIVARENTTTTHSETRASGFGMNSSVYGTTTTITDSTSVRNVGSGLQVGGNAEIIATNDITVQGSTVSVDGSGTLEAENINVLAGRNYDESTTTTTKTGILQVSAGSSKGTSAGAEAEASSGRGRASASADVEASATGTGSAGLGFYGKTTDTTETTDLQHVGSALSFGGDLDITADTLTLHGSDISAEKNVGLVVGQTQLLAAEDKSTSKTTSSSLSIGLLASSTNTASADAGASASAVGKGIPGVGANAEANAGVTSENRVDFVQTSKTTTETLDTRNQGSSISAGGNLTVTGDSLLLHGSNMSSGQDMTLDVADQRFTAAEDRSEVRQNSTETSAGLYLDASAQASASANANVGVGGAQGGASASAGVSVEAGLYGSNTTSSSVEGSTTAVTSGLSAGGNLTRNAETISDTGTRITVGNDFNQTADTWTNEAARDTTYASSDSTTHTARVGAFANAGAEAGAKVEYGPGASSSNQPETSKGAGVGASYEYTNETSRSNTDTAVTSNIQVGGNMNSQTTGQTSLEGTNIVAGGDVALQAGSLDYRAAQDHASSSAHDTSGGGSLQVDIVNKTVGVGANYGHDKGNESSSTAVVGGIQAGGNVTLVTQDDMRLEGTQIDAGASATLASGGDFTYDAATSTSQSGSQQVNVGVEVTAGRKEGSGAAEVGYGQGSSSSTTETAGGIRAGGPITIGAGGSASFTGTELSGEGVTVAAVDNVTFRASEDTQQGSNTNVAVSGAGGKGSVTKAGGKEAMESSGEGSIGVGRSTSRSQTQTGSTIDAGSGSINIISGGDTSLTGVQGSAEQGVNITAGGDVTQSAATSSSSSLTVDFSASASGTTQKPVNASTGTGTGTGTTPTGTGTTATNTNTQQKGNAGVSLYVDNESSRSEQQTTLDGGEQGTTINARSTTAQTQATEAVAAATQTAQQMVASPPVKAQVAIPDSLPSGTSVVAKTADGQALPSWLSFDEKTGSFTGTPPADFSGELQLQVSVPQLDGSTSITPVTIRP